MTDNIIWVQENPKPTLQHLHRLSQTFVKIYFNLPQCAYVHCAVCTYTQYLKLHFLDMRVQSESSSHLQNPVLCKCRCALHIKKRYLCALFIILQAKSLGKLGKIFLLQKRIFDLVFFSWTLRLLVMDIILQLISSSFNFVTRPHST